MRRRRSIKRRRSISRRRPAVGRRRRRSKLLRIGYRL